MTRAEPLHTPADGAQPNTQTTNDMETACLRDAVQTAVRQYLDELDGQLSTDVYQMVLAQIEAPLLEEIMAYTRNNQTKAAHMLGLNRGTLRKKLKQYQLIADKT
ncbi:MAG: DNA-binding transcriptional regulator Fis [Pseudomonadota bacterium]